MKQQAVSFNPKNDFLLGPSSLARTKLDSGDNSSDPYDLPKSIQTTNLLDLASESKSYKRTASNVT